MRIGLVGVVVLLALTGCAPNTDAAYTRCYETLKLAVELDDTLTADETITGLVDVGSTCLAASQADPVAFNERWSD